MKPRTVLSHTGFVIARPIRTWEEEPVRRGAPCPPDAARIATGTRDGVLHLLEEGQRPARPAIATAARAAHARLEAEIVVAAHDEDIRRPIGPRKEPPTATHKALAGSTAYGIILAPA